MTNILIVDDSEQVRFFLAKILKARGFAITLASDGISAIEKYNEARPDYILSDIQMPNMGGLELASYLHFHNNENLTLMTSTDVALLQGNHLCNPGIKKIIHKSIFTDDLDSGVKIITESSSELLNYQY